MNLSAEERAFLSLKDREEGMPLCRWSGVKVLKNTTLTGSLNFYGDTISTVSKWQTNMRSANQLEDPYRAVWKRMYYHIVPDDFSVVKDEATLNAILNTSKALREGIFFETKVVDKEYTEYPGWLTPSGGGLAGSIGSTTASAAVVTGGFETGGVPSVNNYAAISLMVPKLKSFYITAQSAKPGGIAIPNVVDFWLFNVVMGPTSRAEH